jgi:hypothetical protein
MTTTTTTTTKRTKTTGRPRSHRDETARGRGRRRGAAMTTWLLVAGRSVCVVSRRRAFRTPRPCWCAPGAATWQICRNEQVCPAPTTPKDCEVRLEQQQSALRELVVRWCAHNSSLYNDNPIPFLCFTLSPYIVNSALWPTTELVKLKEVVTSVKKE